jgi:hypothetical protein
MNQATCYHGRRTPGIAVPGHPRGGVTVEAHDVDALARWPLPHYKRHSPAGFEWGYSGSGPADLARCLIIDALGPHARCDVCKGTRSIVWDDHSEDWLPARDAHNPDPEQIGPCGACDDGFVPLPYQAFKFAVVAHWEQDRWRISRLEVLGWLVKHYDEPDSGGRPGWLQAALADLRAASAP